MADTPRIVCKGEQGAAKCVVITNVKIDVAANIATASVDPINVAGFRSGSFVSATVGAAAVTYYGCHEREGTYKLIATNANAALSVTAADNSAIPIKDEAFRFAWIKLIHASAAKTDLTVTLKS